MIWISTSSGVTDGLSTIMWFSSNYRNILIEGDFNTVCQLFHYNHFCGRCKTFHSRRLDKSDRSSPKVSALYTLLLCPWMKRKFKKYGYIFNGTWLVPCNIYRSIVHPQIITNDAFHLSTTSEKCIISAEAPTTCHHRSSSRGIHFTFIHGIITRYWLLITSPCIIVHLHLLWHPGFRKNKTIPPGQQWIMSRSVKVFPISRRNSSDMKRLPHLGPIPFRLQQQARLFHPWL